MNKSDGAKPNSTRRAIDWDSPSWGGRVHYAENGSWVRDRHDEAPDGES